MNNIFPYPILFLILIFIAILTFFIKRSDKRQQDGIEEFWEKERQASLTPAVDLSTIAYLNIPTEKFYFGTVDSDEVRGMESELIELSKKPLLNLTNMTNTELKATYGSPNLEAMKKIGDDFDKLTVVLVSYAEALMSEGHISEAITVLEYGVFIKSDVSKTYTLLADCFAKLHQPRRIITLKDSVKPLHLLMEPVIMSHLDDLLSELDDSTEHFDA